MCCPVFTFFATVQFLPSVLQHVLPQITRESKSIVALVALEWFLPRMRLHVLLQSPRSSASVVALVTFEWFFSGVLPHHVNFQISSSIARKLARCASVWLFTRVRLLVPSQFA